MALAAINQTQEMAWMPWFDCRFCHQACATKKVAQPFRHATMDYQDCSPIPIHLESLARFLRTVMLRVSQDPRTPLADFLMVALVARYLLCLALYLKARRVPILHRQRLLTQACQRFHPALRPQAADHLLHQQCHQAFCPKFTKTIPCNLRSNLLSMVSRTSLINDVGVILNMLVTVTLGLALSEETVLWSPTTRLRLQVGAG